jgi:hypothetical protein
MTGHATLEINPSSAEKDSIVMAVKMPREEEWRLYRTKDKSLKPLQLCKGFPLIWAEDNPLGLEHKHRPTIIDLILETSPQRQRQYPVSLEAHIGIWTHLTQLKEACILMECQSPWNTPLLSVKKPDGGYRQVQVF